MRHTPTQAVIPPSILSQNFLQSISPSQSASPSVAQYSAGLAHDARNMLAAMDIYCELLSSPGVLKPGDKHLLVELRLLRDSSGQLLDRLLVEALKCLASSDQIHSSTYAPASPSANHSPQSRLMTAGVALPVVSLRAANPAVLYDPVEIETGPDAFDQPDGFHQSAVYPSPSSTGSSETVLGTAALASQTLSSPKGRRVINLAAELQATLPMLSALAGPRVHVSLALTNCPACELIMPQVDLTRVLINLVRNAAEAMSVGGRILIAATLLNPASSGQNAEDGTDVPADVASVLLSIEDNGPGIPLSLLDRIFDLQVSGATQEEAGRQRMQFRPRGLGLRIVRDFVEASGGTVRALRLPDRGSRFEIVLPMVTVEVTKVGRAM